MTVKEIEQRVAAIRDMAGDDEIAHAAENALHQKVLSEVAAGRCEDPKACAAAALETLNIRFKRWCA